MSKDLLEAIIPTAVFITCIYIAIRNARKLDKLHNSGKIPDINKAKFWAVLGGIMAAILPIVAYFVVVWGVEGFLIIGI